MKKWQELIMDMTQFEEDFYSRFLCDPEAITLEKLESSSKATRSGAGEMKLSEWIVKFAAVYDRMKVLTVASSSKIEELNANLMNKQEKVISLQEELLKNKDDQLATIQTIVRDEVASVQTVVKAEIGSWSEVVQRNTSQPITTASLKEAVKSVVSEDDRSRNIIIFGKEDVENEDLSQTVAAIFEDLGEKPRTVESRRIGASRPGKCRPIKVKLSTSDAVAHVLRRARVLKASEKNSSTYIAPDRNQEERQALKKLVDRMREKWDKDPENYHFIGAGQIASVKRRTGNGSHTKGE